MNSINKNLLKASIAAAGLTQYQLSNMLNMAQSTFIRKLKSNSFKMDEAQKIVEILNIEDPIAVFFDKKDTYKVTNDNSKLIKRKG